LSLHQEGKVALVVDDEVFARLYAAQILLDEGFTVLEAADAAEGLEVLNRNSAVDLLFTDISMPGEMDGLALINKARGIRPDIALLVTSGLMQPQDGDIAWGVKFLPKPYTAQALMRMIRQLQSSALGH
jgi:CheY-like chemotaxis protein